MRKYFLVIFLFAGFQLSCHPLHLSITNISIDGRDLTVSMKTFRDDWGVAYFHFHGKPLDLASVNLKEFPWFLDYLRNSFIISSGSNSKPYSLELDTIIFEDQNMAIEMHVVLKEEPKSLYLYNTILADIFPDQSNLVIIGYKNRETGIKFDLKKHAETIRLSKQ